MEDRAPRKKHRALARHREAADTPDLGPWWLLLLLLLEGWVFFFAWPVYHFLNGQIVAGVLASIAVIAILVLLARRAHAASGEQNKRRLERAKRRKQRLLARRLRRAASR